MEFGREGPQILPKVKCAAIGEEGRGRRVERPELETRSYVFKTCMARRELADANSKVTVTGKTAPVNFSKSLKCMCI